MARTLWDDLCEIRTLKRGWHIARSELSRDFAEIPYATDCIARDLDRYLHELSTCLKSGTYRPGALIEVDVPKGPFGLRPGSVLQLRDRIVANAIVLLIAPKLDRRLRPCVYSWRVQKPFPKKGPIFDEGALEDMPFLKAKTIRKWIDPQEPWYALWPRFDQESKEMILGTGAKFRYMATSDIAAYFENIQLQLLREHLLSGLPGERQIINLLLGMLESWVVKSMDGFTPDRGIPQGSSVGSFLGNYFLKPLDDAIWAMRRSGRIAYFRYMDDVRIFTNSMEDAREALLTMLRTLRRLHLNVQTAKTRVLDEKLGEVTAHLHDERIVELARMKDQISIAYGDKDVPPSVRSHYLTRLSVIARQDSASEKAQTIMRARKPLEGLTSRAFRMWISLHQRLNSPAYVPRLLREVELNPDDKLGQKLISTAKSFPGRRGIERRILEFLESDANLYPFQEAQCIRALRYLSNPSLHVKRFCLAALTSSRSNTHTRIQAAMLLARMELTAAELRRVKEVLDSDSDPLSKCAVAAIALRRPPNKALVQRLVFDPNDHLRMFGAFVRTIKNEERAAASELDHGLSSGHSHVRLCDRAAFVAIIGSSDNLQIQKLLVRRLTPSAIQGAPAGMRAALRQIKRDLKVKIGLSTRVPMI